MTALDEQPAKASERFGDLLNPILVKEVRQALRGRYFRLSFSFTLLAASVASLGYLVFRSATFDELGAQPLGVTFYTLNFACIAIATHGLVPFSAFVAMGSEWDENTYDLLVLSNLRPRQIVMGKVLSAGVQSLLFYSAFGPFLVFAFLLRGVDLWALVVTLGGSMVLTFSLSCLAVSLSTLARQRFARIAMMGLLAAFLAMAVTMPSISAAAVLVRFPGDLHEPEALAGILGVFSLFIGVAIFFVLIAASRLAHPEENRSTGLRIYAAALPVLFLGWVSYMSLVHIGVEAELILIAAMVTQVFLALAALSFCTEPERLGRRVRRQVPRRALASIFAAPFLPGGGRGLLWYLVGNLLVAAWMLIFQAVALGRDPSMRVLTPSQWNVPLIIGSLGTVYIGLASLVFSRHSINPRTRIGARVTALGLFFGSILLPALVGFFMGKTEWTEMNHQLNPVWIVFCHLEGEPELVPGALASVVLLASIVLAANSPRLLASLREVVGAPRSG